TPRQSLPHCRIVITRFDTTDVEASILGLLHARSFPHHTGGHRCFTLCVTDVEALNAARRVCQFKRSLQSFKLVLGTASLALARLDGEFGIGESHLDPGLLTQETGRDDNRIFIQHLLQYRSGVFRLSAFNDELGWRGMIEIMLFDESEQRISTRE